MTVTQKHNYDNSNNGDVFINYNYYSGRTHQLRVHCQSYGHIIVGDYTYSNRTDTKPYRMMLHAYRLVAQLPGELIDVTAPDPFVQQVDQLWSPEQTFVTYEDFLKLEQVDVKRDQKMKSSRKKGDSRPGGSSK